MGQKKILDDNDFIKTTNGEDLYKIIRPTAKRFYYSYRAVLPTYMSLEDFIQEAILHFIELKKTPSVKYVCHHVVDRNYPKGISRKIFSTITQPIYIPYEFPLDETMEGRSYLSPEDSYDLKKAVEAIDNIREQDKEAFIETYVMGTKPKKYAEEIGVRENSVRKKMAKAMKSVRDDLDIKVEPVKRRRKKNAKKDDYL